MKATHNITFKIDSVKFPVFKACGILHKKRVSHTRNSVKNSGNLKISILAERYG